jgi:hypothetical protein
VFDLIRLGILNACSVGFKPLEYVRDDARGGINFLRQSLLEWSVVPVPANAEALVTARGKGIDTAPVLAWAREVEKQLGTPVEIPVASALGSVAKAAVPDEPLDANTELRLKDGDDAPPADDVKAMENCPQCRQMAYDGMTCSACGYAAGKSVPPESQATGDTCPACGASYDGKVCGACAWRSPDADPMNGEVVVSAATPASLKGLRATQHQPAFVTIDAKGDRFQTYRSEDDDPIRWNRQLSKAFDVAGEPLEPSRLEIAWVSRFIEVPVQQLSVETFVRAVGAHGLVPVGVRRVRGRVERARAAQHDDSGREVPPEYETLQLNSRTTRSFMVEGMRFMQRESDNVRRSSARSRAPGAGLYVTPTRATRQAEVRSEFHNTCGSARRS